MSKYRNKKILNHIFLIISIIFVNGKNIKEKDLIDRKRINFKKNFGLIHQINNKLETSENKSFNWIEDYYINNFDYKSNYKISEENKNLKIGRNDLINISDSISRYSFNLSNITKDDKFKIIKILLYTNLTNNLFLVNEEYNNVNISTSFFIISNELIEKSNNSLDFEVFSRNGVVHGFLDLFLLDNTEEEFELNNISRKSFYNDKYILLNKQEKKTKYFINIIPNEEDSDFYYLHCSKNQSKNEKKNIKIYYLNDFKNYTLEEILNKSIKSKEKTRDWKLKGNLEIFAIEYKSLTQDINITLEYKQIKGKGNSGFIITMSVLFALFLITLGFFVKNTYFGNIRTYSDEEKIN